MKNKKWTTWLCAVLALAGSIAATRPAWAHGDEQASVQKPAGGSVTDEEHAEGTLNGPQDKFIKAVKFDQKLDSQVPLDASFRDESGKAVQLKNYFNGKPVVLVMVYFRCKMLCSEVLSEAVRSAKDLKFAAGQEYNVVAISIDARETPQIAREEKAEHMKEYGRPDGEKGWHFLTGNDKQIRRVADSIGFHYAYDAKSDEFAHPNGMVVITPSGKITRYFYGVTYPTRDLKFALMEASEEKIGSPVDQLLLMCFHYDPKTGKYDVLVMKVVRMAGLLTILLIGGGIGIAVRREKKPAPLAKKTIGAGGLKSQNVTIKTKLY